MNKRKVVFLSLSNGIFGNGGQSWLGIDLSLTTDFLVAQGFEVQNSMIDQTNDLALNSGDIVIYSSCEALEIREYMKDAFYFLRERCIVVPDYDFLLAYENKGFQELKKKALGIGNLAGDYHFDLDASVRQLPYVFKTISGAGSSGVHLVRSGRDERWLQRKYFTIGLRRKMILVLRKFALCKADYLAYSYRHKGFRRYVAQAFVPNADHDYKVLVFGKRYFGLKRYVRQGDFRASGSGNFDFTSRLPDKVLDFAAYVAERLDAPQLSLDIVASSDGCHLIEYQALNFGPTTLTLSNGYYLRNSDDGAWVWIETRSDLGDCFAHSIEEYFDKHGIKAV